MKRDFWTLPNLLSLSRAVLVVPFVMVMFSSLEGKRWWALVILLLGALTDKLDGEVARRMHCESEWGRVLDPLADKIGVGAAALVLTWLGDLPLWFVVLLLARDMLIFFGGMYLRHRTGIILPSNMTGKWSVGIFSLTLFGGLMQASSMVLVPLIIASVIMAALSLAFYMQRFLATLSSKQSA